MIQLIQTFNPVAAENTYYIYNEQHVILVDPGSDTEKILTTIESTNCLLVAILLTHTHYDHILSLEAVRSTYEGVPVYVAREEESWLYTPEMNLSGLVRHEDMEDVVCQKADELFEPFQTYEIGGMSFQVLPTPGHSIGGVSFLFEDFVLTGDALFCESIGRTDLPTGDKEVLLNGIRAHLFSLPNHLAVYPGHGKATTIGHEKTFNPFF